MSLASRPSDVVAPSKKRRTFRGRLFRLLLLLLIPVAAAPFSLRLGFVRDAIARSLSTSAGKTVRIGSLSGWWTGGFAVEDLIVESGPGYAEPLLRVPHAHATIAWGRLFRGDIDVVASVTRPEVTLMRGPDGGSNLDGLFPGRDEEARDDRRGIDLVLTVKDARVRVPDSGGADDIGPIDVALRVIGASVDGRVVAVLPKGGVSGNDVTLVADLPETDDGSTRGRLTSSDEIDLARLSALVERVSGHVIERGRVKVDIEASLDGSAPTSAKGGIDATDVVVRDPNGGSLRIDSLTLRVDAPDARSGTLTADLRGVDVVRPRPDGPPLRFTEPTVEARARWTVSPDGATRIDEATLAAGSTAEASLAEPFVLPADDAPWTTGQVRARADLARLAALFGSWPTLARVREGAILAQARVERTATGTPTMSIGVKVERLALAPGPSGEPALRESPIEANLRWRRRSGEDRFDVLRVTSAILRTDEAMRNSPLVLIRSADHVRASGSLGGTVDLRAASAWMRAMGVLPPTDDLSGSLRIEMATEVERLAQRLSGRAHGESVLYRNDPRDEGIRHDAVTIDFDASLPTDGAPGRLHGFRAVARGIEIDATGATWRTGPEPELDATFSLRGDAGALAPSLRRVLGEGYHDLVGSGAIDARVTVRGVPGEGGRRLLANGDGRLGSWRAQGLDIADVTAQIARADIETPLVAKVNARANGGTIAASIAVDLVRTGRPFSAEADVNGLDTSPLLTHRGAGRYLAYAIPALIPADVTTPVVSGRLDARVRLAAAALASPRREDTLTGTAEIRLSEGEIRSSTLFQGAEMGKAVSAIALAVPAAGDGLKGLARALLFTSLDSRARIGDRRVTVDSIDLAGRNATIRGRGFAGFDRRIDMDFDLTLEGRLLAKIGGDGTLPLKATGALDKPRVLPRIDLSKLIGGDFAKDAIDKVRDIFGK